MKKALLSLICVVLLCGCSNDKGKYSEFEHYDLTDYNHKIYSYSEDIADSDSVNGSGYYAVSELVTRNVSSEIVDEGLFYEVGENDFILLDSFPGGGSYDDNKSTRLYKNKMYILRYGFVSEYVLEKEKTKGKELTFDMSQVIVAETISNYFYSIENIDDNYIYLWGDVRGYNGEIPVDDRRGLHFKCSLSDYKCIEIE